MPLGEVKSGNRRRPDGVQLSWQFTDPWVLVADGIVPLFIDWETRLTLPAPRLKAPRWLACAQNIPTCEASAGCCVTSDLIFL